MDAFLRLLDRGSTQLPSGLPFIVLAPALHGTARVDGAGVVRSRCDTYKGVRRWRPQASTSTPMLKTLSMSLTFLGIDWFKRPNRDIYLTQERFTKELLQKHGMAESLKIHPPRPLQKYLVDLQTSCVSMELHRL